MRKFMRTRAASPPPPPPLPPLAKTNGVTNGVGSGPRRDDHSTLTRYWDEPEDGELWEDPDFPAAPASLGDRRLAQRTVWLRPHKYSMFSSSSDAISGVKDINERRRRHLVVEHREFIQNKLNIMNITASLFLLC
ncbi:unnamed protein product, partial [Brenthis ino]